MTMSCPSPRRVCKHEFVFDGLKDRSTGVTTMDVAKRLLDYGTMLLPSASPLLFHEAMMIEPTENESIETLDAFIDVMHKIAEEARTNPEIVKTAPHNTPRSCGRRAGSQAAYPYLETGTRTGIIR